ncbi:MAG: undecaprenyl/decaprenyl-phosphate alpha-N-acetylglucosaminyl 1-phosphate transferase [Phycisphaerales bacterium]|nr:undecaprenyl/decaprenyl-phosphate alpha-N-acetylglucosaminyl 1-phosphate transferase [Phycisphaerales bacterium]
MIQTGPSSTTALPANLFAELDAGTGAGAAHVLERLRSLESDHARLGETIKSAISAVSPEPSKISGWDVLYDYIGVFVVAFLVSLLATPIMRRLAVSHGIIDRPLEARKSHKLPTAYLGGAAVYLGMMAAILFAYAADLHGLVRFHASEKNPGGLVASGVPISILLGMTVIMLTGLIDDVVKISPRIKVAGQLVAAAALAIQNVGVKLAQQIVVPAATALGVPVTEVNGVGTVAFNIPLGGGVEIPVDLVYWTGTALIAIFVLGACNASNLIDGLDGLLTGTTTIATAGLLVVALGMAAVDDGVLDGPRVILCLSLLGACLGFLPHNFNPASIFLGDAGSLLLGFCTIVIIMTLGDTGRTNLVIAGLIIYSIPIMDTTLAIVRRKMAGKPLTAPDDQHLHHMLKRALGVKGAVLALYAIGVGFAILGVALAEGRGRVTYVIALVFASFIIVTAIKIARRRHIEEQAAGFDARKAGTVAARAAALGESAANGAGGLTGPVAAAREPIPAGGPQVIPRSAV